MASIDTGTNHLLLDIEDGVATITLNRPDKRNALGDELTPALREALLTCEQDPGVGCVVITGTGRAFCAGGDVSAMGARREPRSTPAPSLEDQVRALQDGQETLSMRLHELAVPTIAALPGPAAGAGLSIALAADLRIMADSAFMITAFRNVGLSGDYGASWFMTRLVGPARAKELFFTSRRVAAAECLELGLTNRVVPFEDLGAAVRELARDIAAGPAGAIRSMKANLNRAIGGDLRTCLAMEAEAMARSTRTADHREAVRAFMEKRPPRFEHPA